MVSITLEAWSNGQKSVMMGSLRGSGSEGGVGGSTVVVEEDESDGVGAGAGFGGTLASWVALDSAVDNAAWASAKSAGGIFTWLTG